MAKSANQKLKLFYLSKIMLERTDEEHTITVPKIIEELEKLGIKAERKSIYDDLKSLKILGVNVECVKTKTYNYFVANREFQFSELKLLIDAIQSSKFITQKKSLELIKKLENYASNFQSKELNRHVYVANRIKSMNESIYYNIDTIHNAILQNKKITFNYFEWTVQNSSTDNNMGIASRQIRKNGMKYEISPYALCWNNDYYYVIAYYPKYGGISHFRVDKMEQIEISDTFRNGEEHFKKIDMSTYTNKVFGMYGGEEEIVELQFSNSLIGVVVDRFGKDIKIKRIDDDYFSIKVNVEISPTFLAWVYEFGNQVKIVSPESLIDKFKDSINKILEVY